ncbi:hypothetical protein WMF39_18815 [Sorangium sp. So ce1504]|uniref:hypothetical protein n=1 Tax=Sorangium sp. So ce1504 TaxID=3133337 RepID=UPI003F60BF40
MKLTRQNTVITEQLEEIRRTEDTLKKALASEEALRSKREQEQLIERTAGKIKPTLK